MRLPNYTRMMKQFFIFTIAICCCSKASFSQTLNGMATGNYAGIAGLSFNPASIVDSRFKFDLNLAGAQYYFNNNFLYANPATFARRLLTKDPYNSSYESVKNDLLKPIEPSPESRVYARQTTEFNLPLSFMLTTGKKSAIAISLRNRYDLAADNLNPNTARMFYEELDYKPLMGVPMNNDGFKMNFMNWQEFGFTYGRVLLNANKHFFKAAVTAKWLGANAGAFIQADQATVTFNSPTNMNLSSPLIQYGRTVRADFDLFTRRELFSDIADQKIGWDAGFVYEFRGRIGNFNYTDEDYKSRLRRDMNKYTIRLGVALNDVGYLEFNRLPLTRNHSAQISNWDFSGVKANTLRDWDTAYSKKVNYIANSDSTFTIKLPTALIANLDLHLFKGFYINAAIQKRLTNFGKATTTQIATGEWFAVTPRFEGRHFGIYLPLVFSQQNKQVGATIRLGPVYVGSNNVLALIQNPLVPEADIHAGFRIPIGFGKPSKMLKGIEKNSGLELSEQYEKELDSTQVKVGSLEARIAMLEKMADSSFRTPPTVIVNNYIVDSLGNNRINTQVQTQTAPTTKTASKPTVSQAQLDSLQQENEKLKQLAAKNMKKEGVDKPKEPKASKNEKKAKKKQERYEKETRQYNKALEDEMRKMRKQQAFSSAALVGAVSANAIVDANNNKPAKPDTIVKKDTVTIESIRRDTVYVRDTIRVAGTAGTPSIKVDPAISSSVLPEAHVYFESGSAVLGASYKQVLSRAAKWMINNPGKRVLLTGVTDATGSPSFNKQLAGKRISAVENELKKNGVDARMLNKKVQVSDIKTKTSSASNRRVDLTVVE